MRNMDDRQKTRVSRLLSRALRHDPAALGLVLSPQGWIDTTVLLQQLVAHGFPLTLSDLQDIVATNDKQRFAFSDDGSQIRAQQGHSVPLVWDGPAYEPPEVLYHGTVSRFLDSIWAKGLLKGQRHHVHLSATVETAQRVGARRGQPVVLVVQAGAMYRAGFVFYRSNNGVWLTAHVPPAYLSQTDAGDIPA
ncbi:MAG: RNA 2'-phosphotransferase [Bacteroidia bacterium]